MREMKSRRKYGVGQQPGLKLQSSKREGEGVGGGGRGRAVQLDGVLMEMKRERVRGKTLAVLVQPTSPYRVPTKAAAIQHCCGFWYCRIA